MGGNRTHQLQCPFVGIWTPASSLLSSCRCTLLASKEGTAILVRLFVCLHCSYAVSPQARTTALIRLLSLSSLCGPMVSILNKVAPMHATYCSPVVIHGRSDEACVSNFTTHPRSNTRQTQWLCPPQSPTTTIASTSPPSGRPRTGRHPASSSPYNETITSVSPIWLNCEKFWPPTIKANPAYLRSL